MDPYIDMIILNFSKTTKGIFGVDGIFKCKKEFVRLQK